MDAEFEARALGLLDEALEQPVAGRDAWLTERCGAEPALKARVTRLLRSDGENSLRTGAAHLLAADGEHPERIGAYRITGLIGQGGMGAVYRGERAGDFEHVAAIKLIRPGALSDELVDRFRRERQTLARLAHPHIARLFDGGETAAGQPYLVMECVDGRPLHEWLEAERPTRAARLGLFQKICAAVAYAHRNLIIHRDLTPANILVDETGQPKLIDFGIARPADEAGGDAPAETATPGFASPERIAGAPATTLTDIFALGRLLDRLVGDEADADLKAIVARASADDPAARYPSADALADDVDRYCTGRTVAAFAGGRGYVARKFVARNRVGVAATGVALALILGALIVSLVALGRAERARTAETARFTQLRSLAGYMMFDLNDQLRRVPGNVGPRASLAAEAQRYLSGLAGSVDASPALRLEIADGLIELAHVQGSPMEPNLAEGPAARANLARAERELQRLAAETGMTPDIAARLSSIKSHEALIQLHGLKDAKGSEASLGEAARRLATVSPQDRAQDWLQARRLYRRARLEFFDLQERVPDLLREVALLEREIGTWPPAMQASAAAAIDRGQAAYFRGIADLVRSQGDKGMAAFGRALSLYESAWRREPVPGTLLLMGWSAFLAFEAASANGDRATASAMVARATGIARRLQALDDKDDASAVLARNANLAHAKDLADRGLFDRAIQVQQELVANDRRQLAMYNGTGVDLAHAQVALGDIARRAGDRAIACTSWEEAERRYAGIERQGRLLAVFQKALPKLRDNLRLCAANAPVSALKAVS